MTCSTCGANTLAEAQITKTYGEGPTALVVTNVPVLLCSSCGHHEVRANIAKVLEVLREAHDRTVVPFPAKLIAA